MHSLKDYEHTSYIDYINQVWVAIMEMNCFALELLLEYGIDYEDIGKDKFIEKLHDKFQDYKTWGDSELLLDFDNCNGCNCNQPVCKFIGNYSGKVFALFFEIEHGEIIDIYECYSFGEGIYTMPF